jgi:hypothetical protein
MHFPSESPEALWQTDSFGRAESLMEELWVDVLAMDRWRIQNVFLSVMEMQPQIRPGYFPGWEHRAAPTKAVYQSQFEFMVAEYYAGLILEKQLNSEPSPRLNHGEIESVLDESWPTLGSQSEQEITRAEGRILRFNALETERSELIVPELVAHRIRNFGLYRATGKVEMVDAADTADGTALLSSLEHMEQTTVVPARLGVQFGYEFELGGIIPGTKHLLKMRAIHPPIENVEGEMQTVSTAPFDVSETWITRYSNHITYAFNSEYHLIPGRWTLQVLYDDEVIISKRFRVVEVAD